MKKIVIDGLKIDNTKKLHDLLQEELELPDYYGRNLDALWDCITGYIDLPVLFVWKNVEVSREKWGWEFVDSLVDLLEDAKKELGDLFDYKYE